MKTVRKIQALLLATATFLLIGTLGATPANAATGPGGSVITCQLAVHYPHNSTHVFGTVNVSSDILCSSIVDSIYSTTGLRGAQSANGWDQSFNNGYMDSNAAKPCVNGSYWGIGGGTVTFPSGYSPRVQSAEGSGATKSINCSVQGRSAAELEASTDDVVVYEFSATWAG
jgi:hypothetical protein